MPAPATPNLAYVAGDHTTPTPVSLPVFSPPFEGVNVDYVLTQDFQCTLDDFTRESLDTPHEDYTDFLLAHESELRDIGGGMVRWTRTYLKLPDDYTEPRGTINFTFPGFSGLVTGGVVGYGGSDDGRVPQPRTVPLLVERKFYNTDDPQTDIPLEEKFQPTYGTGAVETEYVNDSNGLYGDTDPSRTEYDALVVAGTLINAEDSTWNRWMGNFYIRETYKVAAK